MRRRLRKKLHLGEFQELGFEVEFGLADRCTDAEVERFRDVFIGEAIEPAGLMCGGGCGRRWDVFVAAVRRSATRLDQEHVASWLGRHPDVENVHIGELVDAWHGW